MNESSGFCHENAPRLISECISSMHRILSSTLTDAAHSNPTAGPEILIHKNLSELPAQSPDDPKHRKCHIAALPCSGRSLAKLSASKSRDHFRGQGDRLLVTGGLSTSDSES